MKKNLTFLAILMCLVFVFGQNQDSSDFIETKIESGSTFKKYKNGKLDSIIVTMAAMNYGNALFFSKSNDTIRITNAADKNSIITIEVKNKKQIRTLFYKNKPAFIVENIDLDLKNLPKNGSITSYILDNIISSNNLTANHENLGEENPDKTMKLFGGLQVRTDLDNIDDLFENIGEFFSEEDALLKIFYGRYAEQFSPKILSYFASDASGKIKDGSILDFQNKNINNKNPYKIYKNGKILKFGTANVEDFQNIYIDFLNKLYENKYAQE